MVTSLIPKSLATRVGQVVYDASIEENVTITADMLDKYLTAKEKMYHGFLQIAEALAEVRDYRLYVVVNCHCFEAWITKMAGMSRRSVFNYLAIIQKYGNRSGLVQLSPDMQKLGISKLLVATKLPKKDFERFKRTGDIEIGDRCLGVDDIRMMSVREFESVIRVKACRRAHSNERRAIPPAEDRSRKTLHRLLHDLEEGLIKLRDEKYEHYEAWEAELRRIYAEVVKHEVSYDDEKVQTSALNCERNHNTMMSSR